MITRFGEAAAQMVGGKVMFRVAAVAAAGGAVDDDKVDSSHYLNGG